MKICYQSKTFSAGSKRVIDRANEILEQYAAQGYDLTLRQLYYQFVARGYIPNKDTEYKRLGSIVNDARLAGLIDWDHITDRTRNLRSNAHWDSPKDIVSACSQQFQFDKWASQKDYVEVWVEKDALIGVIETACRPLDVPFFSCRGYTSQSEIWAASQRLLEKVRAGKHVTIVHLGDHDPSGVDMSRDIEDRMKMFLEHHMLRDFLKEDRVRHSPLENENSSAWVKRTGFKGIVERFTLNRIALTMDQIREYNPPPNPAKLTDARSTKYIADYGDESWELDALEPAVITDLIRGAVAELRDEEAWDKAVTKEKLAKRDLSKVAENWPKVISSLK